MERENSPADGQACHNPDVVQRTFVVQVDPKRAPEFELQLQGLGYEIRPAPHAFFSAKGAGVVATLYRSGKFVLQGGDPEAFAERLQIGASSAPVSSAASASDSSASAATLIGSDESGKGDYFGPLVVAAVRLDAAMRAKLAGGPVRDCKQMSDESVLRVGAALRTQVPFCVQRLDPPEYNALHAKERNLNPMLGALHARAIGALATPGMRVLIDQFADERLMRRLVAPLGVELEQRFRGEEELAVAAASVIAREEFLRALQEASQEWAMDLAKGAGEPTDRAARRFAELHGQEALGQVAKLHFRTTEKLFGTSIYGASARPAFRKYKKKA